MSEVKRIFSASVCILFLMFSFLCASLEKRSSPNYSKGYGGIYGDVISDLQGKTGEEAELYLSNLQLESDRASNAYDYYNYPEFWFTTDAIKLFGPDYEQAIAQTDVSEENMSKYYALNQVIKRVKEQLAYLDTHDAYLASVHSTAHKNVTVPIFARNPYNRADGEKTDADYPQPGDAVLSLEPTQSYEVFMQGDRDAFFALCWCVFLTVRFTEEQKKSLRCLIYGSKNGRVNITLRRLAVLLGGALFSVSVMSFLRLWICVKKYGPLASLTVPLQCCTLYEDCVLNLTVGQYLVAATLLKALGVFTVSAAMWMLMTLLQNVKVVFLAAAVVTAVEYTLYSQLANSSTYAWLRYVNLAAFLAPDSVLRQYRNVNVLGHPLTGYKLTVGFLCFCTVLFTALILLASEKQKPIRIIGSKGTPRPLKAIACFLLRRQGKLAFECRKSVFFERGLLILFAFTAAILMTNNTPISDGDLYDSDATYVKMKINAPVTEETFGQLAELKADSVPMNAADRTRIKALFADLNAEAEEKLALGENSWMMNEAPFASIFAKTNRFSQLHSLLVLAAAILLGSGVFPYERQSNMESLLYASKNGRGKTVTLKLLYIGIAAVLLYLAETALEIRAIGAYFPSFYDTLQAPVHSLRMLEDYPVNIPLWSYTLFYYGKRLTVVLAAVYASCLLSLLFRSVNTSAAVNALLFLFPMLLCYLGLPGVEYLSFSSLWSPTGISGWWYLACIAVTGVSIPLIYRLRLRKKY